LLVACGTYYRGLFEGYVRLMISVRRLFIQPTPEEIMNVCAAILSGYLFQVYVRPRNGSQNSEADKC